MNGNTRELIAACILKPIRRFLKGNFKPQIVADCFSYRELGEEGADCFFGYHDLSPDHPVSGKVLAHKKNSDHGRYEALVGYFSLHSPTRFEVLGKSLACSRQMATRLQWVPGPRERAIYNDVKDGMAIAKSIDLGSRAVKEYPSPIFDLSPTESIALSLDFTRLELFRPGYGFAIDKNTKKAEPRLPKTAAITSLNLENGNVSQIVSYQHLVNIGKEDSMTDAFHYVNHIKFSPSGRKFLFFHVWLGDASLHAVRKARIMIANSDGKGLRCLENLSFVSHFCWLDEDNILCFCARAGEAPSYRIINTANACLEADPFKGQLPSVDGHPMFRQDAGIVVDTYPDKLGYQTLFLIPPNQPKIRIGRFKSHWRYRGINRCDLHPRWSVKGDRLFFDSAHTGLRRLCVVGLHGN